MLLDEPFNWLDPVAAYDAKSCFVGMAANTVLVTALHDAATFPTRCCGGVLMHNGRIARASTAPIEQPRNAFPAFEREVYEALRTSGE